MLLSTDSNPYMYPVMPGHKGVSTSLDAAVVIAPSVQALRDGVLALLRREPLTADECAAKMYESLLSIRPRCSELRKLGLIRDSGMRRKNASGRSAVVWTTNPVQTTLF